MLSQNKWLLLLLPFILTSCGFRPLYAKKTDEQDVSKVFAGVTIDPIPGRTGQLLKSSLEDKLNPKGAIPDKAAYRLSATIKSSVLPIGVARDGTVSRYNVYMTSKYTLYRTSDGKPVTSGDIGYVDSYNNVVNEYFSTYVSEEDAYKNGIVQLSELYSQRLGSYLEEGAPVQPVKPDTLSKDSSPVPLNPMIFNQNQSYKTPYQ